MLLTIDVGNSHTVIGLFQGDELLGQYRLQSHRGTTGDELALSCHSLLALAGLTEGAIRGVVLASVVPILETTWGHCCERLFSQHLAGPPLVVTGQGVERHLRIETDAPAQIGPDRLINALYGAHHYPGAVIIIDFGTAVTLDCVAPGHIFLGGAILPGIGIGLEALSSRTARLPRIDLAVAPGKVIGTNTVAAMQSGILHGYGALVDGLVAKMGQEMGTAPLVVATGGMAGLIAPYAGSIRECDPLLTLKGMALFHRLENGHE